MATRTIERPKAEKITEPPKRWRNWWKCLSETGVCPVRGHAFREGEVFHGIAVYPTKEIAEERAREAADRRIAEHGFLSLEYLGAFPVEAT